MTAHQKFYDECLAVMDLPTKYYLQTIRMVFQEHALPEGTFTWRGRTVDPAAINDIGLMTIKGELDDISGLSQTKAAHTLCRNLPETLRRHHEQANTGHYGIFNGRRWRNEIMPKVREMIRSRD